MSAVETGIKTKQECEVHGKGKKTANRGLLVLLAISFLIIAWRVWVYGPTNPLVTAKVSIGTYPFLLISELWDMVFGGGGIVPHFQDIMWYFLSGVLIAGFIRTFKLAIKLRNLLNRFGFASIFIAAFVGIVTPLCACGMLTIVITLLVSGVPLSVAMALLISSPLMGPTAFLLTMADLGPQWTAIRVIAALSMGIFAGTITHLLRHKGFDQVDSLFREGSVPEGDFHDPAYPDERLRCSCKESFGNRVAAKTNNLFVIYWAKSADVLLMVGKYVLIGIVIGALVQRYMPIAWIGRLFGRKDPLNIVWITFGTIPLFLHQITLSAILLNIKNSLNGTLDGGAALAFMIGGPVTAIPCMVMLWTMFKKRVFFLYLFIAVFGTIFIAFLFRFFIFVPYVDTDNPLIRGVHSISGGSSSIINKLDKRVKVVMDPDNKTMIAVYDNEDYMTRVVFDAGFDRFLNASNGNVDNYQYLRNTANWLGGYGILAKQKNILIYNTFHQSGLARKTFEKNIKASLKAQNYAVDFYDRKELPKINKITLENYGQLWILAGESSSQPYFSSPELKTINNFTNDGGGLLIAAESIDAKLNKWNTAANQIASRYGVRFSHSVKHNKELHVATMYHFFDQISNTLGKIYKLF